MIKLIGDIRPSQISGVALSGGVDSMALLSFLRNNRPNSVIAYFFDHGTKTSAEARQFVTEYCLDNGVSLNIGVLMGEKPAQESWEEFWRIQRYSWLFKQISDRLNYEDTHYVATAHHLNDVAETYIWGMAHGNPRYIHYTMPNPLGYIIRPLLLTPKSELVSWCDRHNIPYIQDDSNFNTDFTRNHIRHNIFPEMLKVNPGFLRTVEKCWKDHFDYP